MITLALIWQWNRIAHLLKSPEEVMQEEFQRKSARNLVYTQVAFLVFFFLLDALLLLLHF